MFNNIGNITATNFGIVDITLVEWIFYIVIFSILVYLFRNHFSIEQDNENK